MHHALKVKFHINSLHNHGLRNISSVVIIPERSTGSICATASERLLVYDDIDRYLLYYL